MGKTCRCGHSLHDHLLPTEDADEPCWLCDCDQFRDDSEPVEPECNVPQEDE